MNWAEFRRSAPELARLGEERFDRTGLALVGTIRADGFPRISPVEPFIVGDDLMLGMMWRSLKARDLLRDPRLVVHSTVSDREGTEGDFKLYGRATQVTNPASRGHYADAVEARIDWRPSDPYHLFSVDVDSAGFVVFGGERLGLAWDPGRGLRRWTIPPS